MLTVYCLLGLSLRHGNGMNRSREDTLAFERHEANSNSGVIINLLMAFGLFVAFIIWWTSLPLTNPNALDDYGLISILPWQFWGSIVLVSLCFVFGLKFSSVVPWARPAALLIFILLLHATTPLVYGTLRYSWAWKHIGIVDYIQRYGGVNRMEPFLSAYHNWPGFFWISAQAADFLKMGPLEIANVARFFPVVSNVIYVVLLGKIFRRFTDNQRVVWAALWIFSCANWVGQDYYSPQAFSYALYLFALTLCLGPLMPRTTIRKKTLFRTRTWFVQLAPKASLNSSWLNITAVFFFAFAVFGIVASHQLTPLILAFSLLGLSIFAPLSSGYPVLTILALVFWVIYPAAPFTSLYLPREIADIGQTMDGVTNKMVNTSSVERGVAVVVWAGRALSGAIVFLALFGWLRSIKNRKPVAIVCVLLIAPGLVLGLTSYGGEAVFRIYFFCSPFLAFFAAVALFPDRNAKSGALSYIVFFPIILLMSLGFLLGNNGKDRQYRFSPEEVEAAWWLYSQSRPGTLLVEGDRSYPSQFMNYENFQYLPISRERPKDLAEIIEKPASVFSRWFSDPRWQDGYVIITRSQKASVEALGVVPEGTFDNLELDLMASPDFLLVYANKDARIFRASHFSKFE